MSGTPASTSRPSGSGTPNNNKDPPKKKKPYYHPYVNKKRSSFINQKLANEYDDKPFSFYIKANSTTQSHDEKSLQAIINTNTDIAAGALPDGWKLYFHEEDVEVLDIERVLRQVKAFRDYLQSHPGQIDEDCQVDMDDIKMSGWKTFPEDLLDKPAHTLSCLAFAMHLQMNDMAKRRKFRLFERKHLQVIQARILNLDLPLTQFTSLSVENNVGSLVRVRGTVVRANDPSINWVWRVFICDACSNRQAVLQRDGKPSIPNECKACKKRSPEFDEDLKSYFSCPMESQLIRIQESAKDRPANSRAAPKFFDIRVSKGLVNKAAPGSDISCIGIIKSKVDGNQVWSLYLDAVHLYHTDEYEFDDPEDFTQTDFSILQRLKLEPNPFRILVQSMCPKISGKELIKAGLLLGIFSGSPKTYKGERREAHVLVVGDPGMGKSEMLEACSFLAPRGIFVSSNSATNSGLTASAAQDSSHNVAVEAGALVMADQGVCCIDELDKITAKKEILLEVMEDQIVNISKAGVITTLSAKTSILAAANPIGGHYNKLKKVTENLKLSLAILSRFDLVYITIDNHDVDLETRFRLPRSSSMVSSIASSSTTSTMTSTNNSESTLISRLKLDGEEVFQPISMKIIQKWISYVNQNYLPELSDGAKAVLKEYFLTLRRQPFFSDIIPVTMRQLVSLIRLTQARAKIDFCRVATAQHAKDVVELIEYGMRDVRNITEHDIIIQSNSLLKQPKVSKKKQLDNFTRLLQIRANSAKVTTFHKSELKEVADRANIRNFNEIIDLMNINGVLLMKGGDQYQFLNQ